MTRFKKRKPIEDRFWEKVDKKSTEECWNWTGAKAGKYGLLWAWDKYEKAHRISYKLFIGEILPGMYICHKCDNPSCVNPSHLFMGTAKDNGHDCVIKGRRPSYPGELNPQAKITEDQAKEIYLLCKDGTIFQRDIGDMFGLNKGTISDIWNRRIWKKATEGL